MNRDEAVQAIVRQFVRQTGVFAHFITNYVKRTHPEAKKEIQQLKRLVKKLDALQAQMEN